MVIHKILNNNFVIVKGEKGNEMIAMGLGIAFNKRVGYEIRQDEIEKIFYLSSSDLNSKLQELLINTPIEFVKLVEALIIEIKLQLGKNIKDIIYISLVDHIYSSMKRFQEGIVISNALLWDIKRFYPEEYKLGLKALDMIEQQYNMRLPDDEAGFIALHIVNACLEEDSKNIYKITKIMQEITNIVRLYFSIEFDTNSVYYYRFITHLRFFTQRIIENKHYKESKEDDELLNIIKLKYAKSYNCVLKLEELLDKEYGYLISKDEKIYLTIHIEKIVS